MLKNKSKKYFENTDLMSIFTFIVLASLVFTIVYNIIVGGIYLRNEETHFSLIWDYLLHVYAASNKSVYPSYLLIFPPFAYLLYYLCYRSDATIPAGTDYLQVENRPLALDTYHIYYFLVIVQFILYVIVLNEVFKKYDIKKRILFILAALLSYPLYYMCIYNGNAVLATVLMLLVAMLILDNDRVDEKHKFFAMILIALSSGLKIIPAVFGLELIRKKDYKNAIILLVMGLAVFILPFFFFEGFKTMFKYIDTVLELNEFADSLNTSIWYVPEKIMLYLGFSTGKYSYVLLILKLLFFAINIFAYFKAKTAWQRMLILGFICAQFYSRSYNYYLSYYLIGIVFLFRDENLKISDCAKKGKELYLLLILLLSAAFALYFIKYEKSIHAIFSVLSIFVVYIMIIKDCLKQSKSIRVY